MITTNQQILSNTNIYQIIDSIHACVYWKDNNGRYLECNQYMLSIFNLTKEQIIGKTDYDLFPKEIADKTTAADKMVLAGNHYNNEEALTINGKRNTYLTNKVQIYDKEGNICGIFGTSIVIPNAETEQEKFIQWIKTPRNRQIIDAVNASIYWRHKDGYYLGCNKYMLDLFGFSSVETNTQGSCRSGK